MNHVAKFLEEMHLDPTALGLFFASFMFVFILWRWHESDGTFDFREALIDRDSGKISFGRLGNITALFVTSELMIYEAIKGRLSEWMFMGYLAAWAGTFLASKYLDKTPPSKV